MTLKDSLPRKIYGDGDSQYGVCRAVPAKPYPKRYQKECGDGKGYGFVSFPHRRIVPQIQRVGI